MASQQEDFTRLSQTVLFYSIVPKAWRQNAEKNSSLTSSQATSCFMCTSVSTYLPRTQTTPLPKAQTPTVQLLYPVPLPSYTAVGASVRLSVLAGTEGKTALSFWNHHNVLFVLSRVGSLFRLPAWFMALTMKM